MMRHKASIPIQYRLWFSASPHLRVRIFFLSPSLFLAIELYDNCLHTKGFHEEACILYHLTTFSAPAAFPPIPSVLPRDPAFPSLRDHRERHNHREPPYSANC